MGYDLRACLSEPYHLKPRECVRVRTGFCLELPSGWAGLVVARSGLASRHQVVPVNAPGVIDPSYRLEVEVALVNLGYRLFTLEPMMRVAQLLFVPVFTPAIQVVEEIEPTSRGGFGSTGVE